MNGWMNGWMVGWMDEWMDGWMNGWMNVSYNRIDIIKKTSIEYVNLYTLKY